jgi:hypothetical protein
MFRYWDGTEWTEHRSPKAGPPQYEDNSGTGIIASAWELFKNNWTSLLGIGALTFLVALVGAALLIVAVISALDPDIFDIADRVLDSGFDADANPEDQAFLDSIEFSFSASFVALALAGSLIATLAIFVGTGTSTLFLGAAHHGQQIGVGACFRLALKRLLRWVGITILWGLVGFLPLVVLWALAFALAPILLVAVIPLTIAAVVYLFPIMTIAGAGLFLGPVDRPPFRTAMALVRDQWGTVALRVLVVNVILLAINIALGVVNLIPLIGILMNIVGQFVYYGLQTATSVKLYASVDGPFSTEISPAGDL